MQDATGQEDGISSFLVGKRAGSAGDSFVALVNLANMSGRLFYRRDNLLRGIKDVVGGNQAQSTFIQSLLASLDVIALQTNYQRNADMSFASGLDNAVCDDIAVHNSAENIDQDALDVLVAQNDSKGCGDLLLTGAPSHVQEVGWFAASKLYDVHRRHGQSCSIDEAGNVAIQPDIIQAMLGSRDFAGILLGNVAHGHDAGLTVKSIIIEIELCVEGEQLAFGRHHERIDLYHGAIAFDKKFVEIGEEFGRVIHQRTGEAQRGSNITGLIRHKPQSWIHADANDLLRSFSATASMSTPLQCSR